MKQARQSFGAPYNCQYDWDEDCFVQCGGNGIVLSKGLEETLSSESLPELADNLVKNTSYVTAFFEAFPKNPSTFIRGEGKTIEDAEKEAWQKFKRISVCEHKEFERRNYKNGLGFCTSCGMSKSKAFEPLTRCKVCDKPTYDSSDIKGNWYCEQHPVPVELMHPWMIELKREIEEAKQRHETNY